jgi:hypothetical protein
MAYGLAVPCRWALALLLSFSKGALLLGVPVALLTIGLLAGGRWLWVTLAGLAVAGLVRRPSCCACRALPRYWTPAAGRPSSA